MNVLVTGGAGFIGSHLVEELVRREYPVRVFDDLSTGLVESVHSAAELVKGDIANDQAVRRATAGVDVVFHLAALTSVPRSVEHPLPTDTTNVHGTLAVLEAARDAGVSRVVYASSSSVYGGAARRPTPESAPPRPRSPYAITKLAGEHYCRVFTELYGLETVALRYFNVFGPRQRLDSPYAAVIPRFVEALCRGRQPIVHGDGCQSRDFTYVGDVVAANLAAATAPAEICSGKVYNVAGGRSHSLLQLLAALGRIVGVEPKPDHVGARPADVLHSQADISAAASELGFAPTVGLEEGLRRTVAWFAARGGRD